MPSTEAKNQASKISRDSAVETIPKLLLCSQHGQKARDIAGEKSNRKSFERNFSYNMCSKMEFKLTFAI